MSLCVLGGEKTFDHRGLTEKPLIDESRPSQANTSPGKAVKVRDASVF